MRIKNLFIAGAGFMGNGIAEMAALAGYEVTMCDLTGERLDAGMEEIESSLGKFKAKDKITGEQYESALGNLSTTTRLEDAGEADLVVEAIPEKLELKKEMFARLDEICPEAAILATNTSAISISAIASATRRPQNVVGTHFFGPVPLMRLCEIIKGLLTSEDTLEAADEWARSLGKETVVVRRDHAGFIANRVTVPGSQEAVRLVEEGLATPEEIDAAATAGSDRGAGPMQILDNAGIDVAFNTAMAIYEDTGEPRFYPLPLMRRMVSANLLGRKTGRGFYDYTSGQREPYDLTGALAGAGKRQAAGEGGDKAVTIIRRILLPNILESARMVEAGVAVPEEIDKASRLGFNLPMGPLELADSMGLDDVLDWAMDFYENTGNFNYFPPALLRQMVKSGSLGRKSGKGFYLY
jgi:3-hydroxybutyryl-CoA dehydrogenase